MRSRLLAGWTTGLLAQLSAIGLLLTSAWLISRAAEQPPVMYLMVAIVSVRAFGIARSVLRYSERLLTHDAAFRLMSEQRLTTYVALDAACPAGLPRGRRGDVISRVVRDVDAFQDRLLRVRIPRSIALVSTLLVTALMALIDWQTGTAMAIAVATLFLGVPALVSRIDSSDEVTSADLRGRLATEVAQAVVAAPDLIAYAATAPVRAQVRDIDRRLATLARRSAWLGGLSSALVLMSMGAVVVAASRFAVVGVADGRLDRVLLAVLVLAPLSLVEPLDQLGPIALTERRVAEALARVAELQAVRPYDDKPLFPTELPARWDLETIGLRVGWTGGLATRPLTVTVGEGDVLGIAGPSGCGKSTLAFTLLGLIGEKGGEIRLGGLDLHRLSGESIRRRIGLMEQDSHIFDTSIRENLRIGRPDASTADMNQALERAGLFGLIGTLPLALETVVGENGSRLSGGERQRLALARLLLADRKILIFDEPTEHLDDLTGMALLDDILGLAPTHTIIVISHSPAVLERIGQVIHLDQPAMNTVGAR